MYQEIINELRQEMPEAASDATLSTYLIGPVVADKPELRADREGLKAAVRAKYLEIKSHDHAASDARIWAGIFGDALDDA